MSPAAPAIPSAARWRRSSRRRPHASSARSPGVRLDDRGEADLLGGEGGAGEQRQRREPPPAPAAATRAVPTSAPAALAPVSPSMARPARSAGQPAERGALRRRRRWAAPRRRGAAGAATSRVAFRARPGRRSSRLARFAVPATTRAGDEGVDGAARSPRRRSASARRGDPATPRPSTLTAPVVTSPRASGAQVAPQPLGRCRPRARSSSGPQALPEPATATTAGHRPATEAASSAPGDGQALRAGSPAHRRGWSGSTGGPDPRR